MVEESADCNRNIGVTYIAQGDFNKAIPFVRDAADLYAKAGIDDERRSSSLHFYAHSLCMTSDFVVARKVISQGKRYPMIFVHSSKSYLFF